MGGLGLLVVLFIVAQVAVNRLFSAQYLEGFLNENLSAEVSVDDVELNLLTRRLTVKGVHLWQDSNQAGVPKNEGIEVEAVSLGVKALPLFSRRIEATSLVIRNPTIRMSLSEEGDWSVSELFRQGDESEDESGNAEDAEEESGVLEAKKNRWLAKLKETRLEGGSLEILFRKKKLLLKVEDLKILVHDLQFDPEDLATLNQVKMDLAAQTRLYDSDSKLLVQMGLDGKANGKLFDEATGDFQADVVADLALSDDSYLDPRVKIVRRVWSYVEEAERLGIGIGDLPNRIKFGRSRRIVGTYREEKVTLQEPLSLSAGKWEVGLARNSWIETASGQHAIGVEFLAGKKISETLGGWLQALPEEAQGLVKSRFVDDEQVLWRVDSKGDLSDPQLEFFSQVPEMDSITDDLKDSLEEEADKIRDKAGDLLKGLFD